LPRPDLASIALGILASGASAAAQETPLQILDPTSRGVLVRFEESIDPAAVGQVFGEAWPAQWSVVGGVGRVELSAELHGLARAALEGLGLAPVPGSFAPLVVEIDLATLEATSEPTSGTLVSGPLSLSFATEAQGSSAQAGFIGPNLGALFCTSQQQVDDLCQIIPLFCGKTCTLVPGAPFDPDTGTLNVVGWESKETCDGAVCQGPVSVFATTGDLLLLEDVAVEVPSASLPLRIGLALLLVALAARALRVRRA